MARGPKIRQSAEETAKRDARLIAAVKSGVAVRTLAPRFGVSERYIREVLAKHECRVQRSRWRD